MLYPRKAEKQKRYITQQLIRSNANVQFDIFNSYLQLSDLWIATLHNVSWVMFVIIFILVLAWCGHLLSTWVPIANRK